MWHAGAAVIAWYNAGVPRTAVFTMLSAWIPASIRALEHYSARDFLHDLIAGLTVGLVALPLAMAFAINALALQLQQRIAHR